MVEFKDEEANNETAPSKSLASIKASVGWKLPEVKLASWDPEDEKQWNVSASTSRALVCHVERTRYNEQFR